MRQKPGGDDASYNIQALYVDLFAYLTLSSRLNVAFHVCENICALVTNVTTS